LGRRRPKFHCGHRLHLHGGFSLDLVSIPPQKHPDLVNPGLRGAGNVEGEKKIVFFTRT
jgi:hypothetical protein